MLITEIDDVAVRRLTSESEAQAWRAGFVGAYQSVFSGFPYFERFQPSDAEGVFQKLVETPESVLLVATRGVTQVVGFGAAIPLAAKPPVATALSGLVPIKHTFYLAELGIIEGYRGKGLGRLLVRERLRLVDPARYSHVVLRVSTNNSPSSEMYKALGFEDMGVSMDVSSMRMDGRVTSDRRVFMSRVLSQVEIGR